MSNIMRKLQVILVVLCYLAVLLWAYATFLSKAFAYEGFTLSWPNAPTIGFLLLLALLPAFLLPLSLSKPSVLILWWLYIAAYIPSILIPPLSLTMPLEKLLPLQGWLLLCMLLLCLVPKAKSLVFGQIVLNPTVFWSLFWSVWIVCIGFICSQGRAQMLAANLVSLFSGGNEYTIRHANDMMVAAAGSSLAYIAGQRAYAPNAFLIAIGIIYHKRVHLSAGIIGQLFIFTLTGHKTILFSSLFLAVASLFMKRWRHSFGLAVTSAVIGAILFCAAADAIFDTVVPSSLWTRRTLAIPGLLTGFYFEHYSQVSHAGVGFHFSHDKAGLLPPFEIGLVYFGNEAISANANLWAEGFAELGVPGMIGFTLITACFLWLYDSVAHRRNLELAVLLVAMPAVTLTNTAPTTVLITFGGFAAALLLYLYPETGIDSEQDVSADRVRWPAIAANSV